MIFEFKSSEKTGLIQAFADSIGGKIENGALVLPESLGSGYIKGFYLGPELRMMIHRYELKEDLIFRRARGKNDNLGITFHDVFQHKEPGSSARTAKNTPFLPSVRVTSADIDFETFFPANTSINTIFIVVQMDYLKELLYPGEGGKLLQKIVPVDRPYLYEEIVSPEIRDVATKMVDAQVTDQLRHFYFKLKAEELIYLFFAELFKREHIASYPLNVADVKIMYQVRDKIIADLSMPPNLTELARGSGISESKMKRLFKQIFGNSIYNYYQTLRMQEAARLLKEQKLSVSEAGYRLGFTNLSHFTRVFESQIGMKPKKYSSTS